MNKNLKKFFTFIAVWIVTFIAIHLVINIVAIIVTMNFFLLRMQEVEVFLVAGYILLQIGMCFTAAIAAVDED